MKPELFDTFNNAVKNNKMVQVFGQYNKYPDERVYRFLNKYSQEKGIEFDPADLICIEYCSDELLQYLQDFRAAKNPFFWRHKEKRPGVQMTIWSIINSDEIPREFDCADFPYDLF